MSDAGELAQVLVNGSTAYQRMDGFGVNINSRYFGEGLLPAMELLRVDLGAVRGINGAYLV